MVGSITQTGTFADESTLTKSGNTFSIKDDGITGDKIADGSITASDLSTGSPVISTSSSLSSTIAGAGNQEVSIELTAIPDTQLVGATALRIKVTGTSTVQNMATGTGTTEIKIQTKEVGGAYGDSMTYKKFHEHQVGASGQSGGQSTHTLEWLHTLTAGEIAEGVQVKLFSKSTGASGNNTTSFTHIQSVVEVV